ncbi:hypothetical protein THOD03_330020 [Vibrio harveyi]|nr:hypothetical protein TH15OA1_190071 [Vibrio harveyi]CAH1567204.1 hypothetical protein THOD03_330020 [Vibrio harveyi]
MRMTTIQTIKKSLLPKSQQLLVLTTGTKQAHSAQVRFNTGQKNGTE